ncbi:MAG: hypothetical protein ACJAT1_000528 [Marivirga sp.]|jgi:hypothetical protein
MKLNKLIIALLLIASVFTLGCKEEENIDSSLRVAFQDFNGTLASADEVLTLKILASKAVDSDVLINMGVSSACDAVVGDFIFRNEAGEVIELAGGIALNTVILKDSLNTRITIEAADGKFPIGTQTLSFDLLSVENAELNDSHLRYELLVGSGSGFLPNNYANGFEACENSLPNDFEAYFADGSKADRAWSCRAEGNESDNALVANAFGGTAGTVDAWIVSEKKLDFSTTSTATINIDVKSDFLGNGTIEFLWSGDYCGAGSPTAFAWENLTALEAQLPEKGSKTYVTISSNISSLIGEAGYFAIRFSGASNDNSTAYAFDNFKLGPVSTGGGGGSGGGGGTTGSSFSTDFEGCTEDFATPDNFFEAFLTAKEDRGWGCRGFGLDDSRAVQASAFGGAEGEDNSWLIIDQSFDFTDLSTVNFQMQMYSNFSGPGAVIAQYSADYSGNGSPSSASWTSLSAVNNAMPAAGSQAWTAINVDVTELGGKTVYIAFQFVGANNAGSSSWAIDNLAINDTDAFDGGSGGGGTGGGSGGGTGGLITQFDTDFEGCTADFSTPDGFFEEFLTAKEDRGWGCRAFGLEDSRAVQASAFGGAEGEDQSWLIFENQFDFAAETSVNVLFSMYSNFAGPGQVIMKYSIDYSGSGKPDAATWTAISAVNSAMPAAGSQVWTEINQNVAELGGKTVYLGFEFVGANNGASSSWAIDNLAINNAAAFN